MLYFYMLHVSFLHSTVVILPIKLTGKLLDSAWLYLTEEMDIAHMPLKWICCN